MASMSGYRPSTDPLIVPLRPKNSESVADERVVTALLSYVCPDENDECQGNGHASHLYYRVEAVAGDEP